MERVSNARQMTVGDDLFAHGGEMGALMRSLAWAETPLGPSEQWPQSLRTAVSICLHSRFPILIWWGADLVMLYNDAYRPILGAKHPQSMGQQGRECWPEIWDVIGPMLEGVLHAGDATWSDNQRLLLNRNGYVEECYFTFSYSPIYGEGGRVDGVFTAVSETTETVLGERRLRTLRDLAVGAEAHTPAEASQLVASVLAHNTADLPFTLIYSIGPTAQTTPNDDTRVNDLSGATAIDGDTPTLTAYTNLADRARAEAIGDDKAIQRALMRVRRSGEAEVVTLAASAPTQMTLAGDQLDGAVRTTLLLPIKPAGAEQVTHVLVAGISPLRTLDGEYRSFLNLVAGHIATAIATATAYELERRRAEALAELDRAKTAFFSNVSHEFRTPLTLMLGPLAEALAAGDAVAPDVHAQLEMAQRNGQRLLRLVNNLLDFSRTEAGRNLANYEPTDLATYTAELASAFRSLIEKAGLRLVVDCPPLVGLPEPVYVDRAMWEKIVLNLLSNAFKFTFTGEIVVRLRRVGLGVELTVRDTGVGVPAAEVGRLFERFHRVEGAHARTYEGSGIGLALTQELVHLHGGTIRAESVEGQGTTFVVRLPLGAAHLPPEHIQTPDASRPTATGAAAYLAEAERWAPDGAVGVVATRLADPLAADHPALPGSGNHGARPRANGDATQRARIVLADDNADMRAYLGRLLGDQYDIETTTNGAEALAAIQRQAPDLVLADIMMPELDGFGLLQAVRGDPQVRALPVILLSARAGEEAVIEGLNAGADDYLIKPFSARELLSRVAARLEIAQARRQTLARAQQLEAIFATMTDGVVLYDNTGRMEQWNDAMAALFEFDADPDYPRLSVSERPARLHVRDAHRQPMTPEQLPFMRAMRGETLTDGHAEDLIITTPSGAEKQVYTSAAPLRDHTGRVIGAVAIYRDVTEQRRARAERERLLAQLQRSEGRLRRLVDANLIGVIFANRDRIVDANDAFLSVVGYSRADLDAGGLPWREMTPPDLLARDDAAIQEMFATDEFAPFEKVFIRKDGSTVPILLGGALLSSEPLECVCFALDLSERKRLEQALSERARLLEAVIDAVPDSLAVYDTDLHITLSNAISRAQIDQITPRHADAANTTLGQRMGEAQPHTLDGAPLLFEMTAQRRALRGEVVSSEDAVEFSVREADGVERVFSVTASPIRDAAGDITGVVTVNHDVTHRRQLEARTHVVLDALLAMAALITAVPAEVPTPTPMVALAPGARVVEQLVRLAQQALAGSYTSVVIVDLDTHAMQPLAMVGLAPADEPDWWATINRTRLEDFLRPEDAASVYAGNDVVVFDPSDAPPVEGREYWGIHTLLVAPAPLDGRLVVLTVEARERSTFTPQERDLARATARLAALVIQRERLMRERAEAQTQAQVMRETTRRMDEFLGIASHELRTPLTSITANVQIAERQMKALLEATSGADAGATDSTAVIRDRLDRYSGLMRSTSRQLVRLDRLVGDLIDTSRIQSGQLQFRLERCDLATIARDAVQEQQALWPDRAVTLDLPRRGELPIEADANRIGQVITNFLTNALKYSAEREPVTTRVTTRNGSVRVAVRDHGPGLTLRQQARLWERFYRVPGVELLSGSGVGLGLGLHICKTIIERHGGEVGVESAPGQGSTFWFTLPLLRG